MKDYAVALRSHDSGGVLFVNTFAVRSDPVGVDIEDATAAQVAAAIFDWLNPAYKHLLAPAYIWDDVQVREIGGTTEGTATAGLTGDLTVGTGILPKELCLIVGVKTSQATRSGRGHMAIPSPRYSSYLADATSWDTGGAYWARVGDLCTTLLAGHNFTYGALGAFTSHLSMRLWSRKHATTYDVTALVRRTPARWLESRETAP